MKVENYLTVEQSKKENEKAIKNSKNVDKFFLISFWIGVIIIILYYFNKGLTEISLISFVILVVLIGILMTIYFIKNWRKNNQKQNKNGT